MDGDPNVPQFKSMRQLTEQDILDGKVPVTQTYARSLADSAPLLADYILDGIAMGPTIRAEVKNRIVNLFLTLWMASQ